MKRPPRVPELEPMEVEKHHNNDLEVAETTFTDTSDICQQLLDRYGKSSAPQHRHLCATAAATRSIIQNESLPLTPFSYFASAISTIADASQTLDSNALSALTSFLTIVLPLVPEKSIPQAKAADAVSILVELVERHSEAVSAASVRAVVKCLGALLSFCDLEDWNSVKSGFETLLKFSIDKRPKVRRCAQDSVVKVLESLESSTVIQEASKLALSLLRSYLPLAVEISASGVMGGAEVEMVTKSEHLEVIHMITLLKLIIPYLSVKISLKVLQQLHKLMNSHFSALTRHILSFIEAFFGTSKDEIVIREAENIIKSLVSYISLAGKNPSDTIYSAATLLKGALDKLQIGAASKWASNLPLAFGSIAGLLTSEASTASQAADILTELINFHMRRSLLTSSENLVGSEVSPRLESSAVKSVCAIFESVLSCCGEIPNVHCLAVLSVLFQKLGETSYFYLKDTILKLAEMMTLASRNNSDTKHLQECIGSAVIAIGPEKILALLPVNPRAADFSCSNVWLIPILSNYLVGSSLQFYIESVVPLAESFQKVCAKAKKSVIREDLQALARGCWGLLPAFCRYPTDTHQSFGSLVELLCTLLNKDSFMLENIAVALQELVNQNRSVIRSNDDVSEYAAIPITSENNDSLIQLESKPRYSKKVANRNIRAIASSSKKLLGALIDVFYDSPPAKRAYLKEAIRCLASVIDPLEAKTLFMSLPERFQLVNDFAELGKQGSHTSALADEGQSNVTSSGKDKRRCLTVELASSFVEGATEDLIALIFNLIKDTLQGSDEVGQRESYSTLSRLLEEHSAFCSSHVDDLMDFLLGLKPPTDITTLGSRFACFQMLLIHAIQRSLEEENSKAFLILNEIILTIKDSTEEARKAAYDMLLGMQSRLQRSPSANSDEHYPKLISMIMGYLSGSSPHIKSGAVSALSIMVYNNAEISLSVPDLVPSVLALLRTKALEVIKSVLGFVKVLVSCHQAKDLQKFLPDIVNGVLPWSSVSRHHLRTKVTVILEIMIRKCGSAAVKLLVPEKHKNFVKSVLENRHGKSTPKHNGVPDLELKVSDSSPRKQQKRKHDESSKMEPRWRPPAKKQRGFMKGVGNSNHDRLAEGQSHGSLRNKRRNFGRNPAAARKTEKQGTKGSQKFGPAGHRFGTDIRHKKMTRKQK